MSALIGVSGDAHMTRFLVVSWEDASAIASDFDDKLITDWIVARLA